MKNKKVEAVEHRDLEEVFQISAEVEFSFTDEEFKGLSPMELKVKKNQKKNIEIENVELRKSTSGLF